ncbi:peptidyl-prolyl cis-trans isomerase fkbp43 [Phtheirospermum japonicum]|uniref:Peptidyl-prolyl cis-trans isomerase fkbp43 n=1 Tax=Phtheirospermum japonicum TaxID=374723 RepID=A0A830BXY2_9LAMI|nr:peptidyl-prolyl cis-trans isomerase fkbp43 [Phtheirospermum japonicum]
MSDAQERFRNIRLQEKYDTHDPNGYCSMSLPFLKKRSKIIEIVAARDIVFALAQSGVCVEVKPGKPITHYCENARGRLRISQLSLSLCIASQYLCESCHLDLEFEEPDDVVFSVIDPRSVYLTGYYVQKIRQSNTHSDTESYGMDIENTHTEGSNYGGDDENYDDSFINDDAELQFSPRSPVNKGNMIIWFLHLFGISNLFIAIDTMELWLEFSEHLCGMASEMDSKLQRRFTLGRQSSGAPGNDVVLASDAYASGDVNDRWGSTLVNNSHFEQNSFMSSGLKKATPDGCENSLSPEVQQGKIDEDDVAVEAETGKIYRSSYKEKYGRSVLVMRPRCQAKKGTGFDDLVPGFGEADQYKNRGMMMMNGIEGIENVYGAPMGYGVVAPLSGTTTTTETLVPMYGSAMTEAFPAETAAIKSDSDLSYAVPFQQQQLEIDRFIAQHTEKVRLEVEERRKRYSRWIAEAVEDNVMKRLKAKEEEIEKMGKLN